MTTIRKPTRWRSVVPCLALAGCMPGVISNPLQGESWALQVDADDALVDPRDPRVSYPNPRGVAWMRITVSASGELCAADGTARWCGGPLQGIPYLTVLRTQPGRRCVRVVDIYGTTVREGCGAGEAEVFAGVAPTAAVPSAPAEPVAAPPPPGAAPSQPALADGDVLTGATLVVAAINHSLKKVGLQTRVTVPGSASALVDYRRGDISMGESTCRDVERHLDDKYSDDHRGTDDFVFGKAAVEECLERGRCRVGQIVTRAMAKACAAIPRGTDPTLAAVGIIGGGGHAVSELCAKGNPEIRRCVGSPLVLDLAGDGLRLAGLAGGVSFPLTGARRMRVGWPTGPDDALLALDVDGDGLITSGRELFGEASGGWAPDGFAALARHDADGDGAITPRDPVFRRLRVWRDDGDGRCTAAELTPLAAHGVRAIPLAAARVDRADGAGNEIGLVGAALTDDGALPLIDVWFAMQSDGAGAR